VGVMNSVSLPSGSEICVYVCMCVCMCVCVCGEGEGGLHTFMKIKNQKRYYKNDYWSDVHVFKPG